MNGTPDRVLELLAAYAGEALSFSDLGCLLDTAGGHVSEQTLRRAVYRLVASGDVTRVWLLRRGSRAARFQLSEQT